MSDVCHEQGHSGVRPESRGFVSSVLFKSQGEYSALPAAGISKIMCTKTF